MDALKVSAISEIMTTKFSELQKNPIFWCVRGLSVYRVYTQSVYVYSTWLSTGRIQWIKSWRFVFELMTSC
jgi:hypothetical protein